MWRKLVIGFVTLMAVAGAACRQNPPETPTPIPPAATTADENISSPTEPLTLADTGVFISELLFGIPGGNNTEFIELYNAGNAPVDLNGWSLWYRFQDDDNEQRLIAWGQTTEIPAHGHFLFARAGQDIGVLPDATFDVPLVQKGGLQLRDRQDNVVDAVGWGDAPIAYASGVPATLPPNGSSLERLPGGNAGSGLNQSDNATDFAANAHPDPQNSGSPTTPTINTPIRISLQSPDSVIPGQPVTLTLVTTNTTDTPLRGVLVAFPVPRPFKLLTAPAGAAEADGRVTWTIADLPANEAVSAQIVLQSPYTYTDLRFRGYYAEANGQRQYGSLAMLTVGGGAIPVAVARELIGQDVIVEGVATMYTGGFFAGTTGTKFYLEDDSGGIQVYVPGGMGAVTVRIGDHVRVRGGIEVYRNSLELVPEVADIELLDTPPGDLTPLPITADQLRADDAILGRLTRLQGTATRIEEFSFSYEIDLADEAGATTLVYVEKETGITAEALELGQQYRVTGISEYYSGQRQLKPRQPDDIAQVFPPILRLDLDAPNSAPPGAVVTVTLHVWNHTPTAMTGVQVTAALPPTNLAQAQALDSGVASGDAVAWLLPELAGDGGEAVLRFTARVPEDAVGDILLPAATAIADQWPDPAQSPAFRLFVGDGVPIWAIQGEGDASPYVRRRLTTSGVVTGVFPDLGGFWVQDAGTDDNPATSEGIFVLVDSFDAVVTVGDIVQVHGLVREISGQTTLYPTTAADLLVVGTAPPPPPIAYDPPQDNDEARLYNEAREGMLVGLAAPAVAVAPTTQYGEYVLVAQHWGVATVPRGAQTGFFIVVDDGSDATHADQRTLPYAIQVGDVITDLVGPLAFTFDQYKIEPLAVPAVMREETELPAFAPATPDQFGIATFNVENLFDYRPPHPSSPAPPDKAGYELRLHKLADAILSMGAPTIIGLQEVEDLGVLQELVALPELAALNYAPYLIEGFDSRGIDVGYLVREDQATVVTVGSYPGPEGLFSRPPLLLTVTLTLGGETNTLYLLNNHFLSLSAGEEATEQTRTDQAAWNVSLIDQLRSTDPNGLFVVMGDLNSFLDTPPLDTLESGGLRHVYRTYDAPADYPYTYIFQGATQSLDHILVSPRLFERLTFVQALHIDAGYPLPAPDDASARHLSDHDPLVVIFSRN